MSDVKRVLEKARERRNRFRRRGFYIVISLLLALLATDYLYSTHRSRQAEARLDAERENIRKAREDSLQAEMERRKLVRIYAQKLDISVNVKNISGELIVSGRIKSGLPFPVGDVELTAYLLAGDGITVLYDRAYTVSSTDGLPLAKGQRRPYRMKLNAVAGAEDIVVLVTGVERKG